MGAYITSGAVIKRDKSSSPWRYCQPGRLNQKDKNISHNNNDQDDIADNKNLSGTTNCRGITLLAIAFTVGLLAALVTER